MHGYTTLDRSIPISLLMNTSSVKRCLTYINLTVTKHYNLKTLKITGEIATADMEAVLMLPEHLKKLYQWKKKSYCQKQVFDCDEIFLFWKKILNHTIIRVPTRPQNLWLRRIIFGNTAAHNIQNQQTLCSLSTKSKKYAVYILVTH